MKKINATSLFLLLLTLLLPASTENKSKNPIKNLPEKYRIWLTEEVVYIITPVEKDVFLKLKTDRERESFMHAFWKQRDPNPHTADNEFQIEHYERIRYANNWFGKNSPAPGWRSDMGRIHILLGTPKHIERFENETEIFPTIIWFYQDMAKLGLPDAFNVVFFKRDGVGEFEIYSPIRDGPQKLMPNFMGDMTDYRSAYEKLTRIQPPVADISLSLIPGEPVTGSPSIASEMLVREKIPDVPQKEVDSIYAEKFLRYKEVVEVDYTANYIDSRNMVYITHDPTGIDFVHFLFEPNSLSMEELEGRFYTQLEIYGSVSDQANSLVSQIRDKINIEMNAEQMRKVSNKLFSLQGVFPVIPGKYHLTILLKNTISKEYTSLEKDIVVEEKPGIGISPLLLGNKLLEKSPYAGQSKPFLFDSSQILPSPRNDFVSSETLHLFFQLRGINSELKNQALLEYILEKEDEKVMAFSKKVSEYGDGIGFLERFPLQNFPPAHYTLKVRLLSKEKVPLASSEAYFFISPMAALPRPWAVSRPQPAPGNPVYLNELGNQYLNIKKTEKALPLLEGAFKADPSSSKFALDYCRLLFTQKKYQQVLAILLPLLRDDNRQEFDLLLGQTYQALGQYAKAITHYIERLKHFGTTNILLNYIGECFMALGNTEEAIRAFEKSLEIDKNQENIQAKVNRLKGEKK